jgi:hypothetical protein
VRKVDRATPEQLAEIKAIQTKLHSAVNSAYGERPRSRTDADMLYGLNLDEPSELFAEMFGNIELRTLAKRTRDTIDPERTLYDRFVELEKKMLGITSTALMIKLIEGGEAEAADAPKDTGAK